MTCQLCGQERKLVRSHAIPEAFFRVVRDEGGEVPRLYSNKAGSHPRRTPIGIYDQTILCASCEALFGKWDDYGARTLINELDQTFQPVTARGEIVAFFGHGVDQERLKMFFTTVLWRAAKSSHDFYSNIRLGPHVDRLRSCILAGKCSDPDLYSVLMSRWTVSPERASFVSGLVSPFPEKWEGINAIRMYFGRVVAYIKVDQRRLPAGLRPTALGMQPYAVQIAREFDGSKDFAAMIKMAKASHGAA